MELKVIAKIHTDFPEKFGIPRQSGLVQSAKGRIIFEPEFRAPEAIRGLEDFSHIWVLWDFSENHRENWSATVTPPRLGGKKRMGVFATRSSFRPNPIGMSALKLEKIYQDEKYGWVIEVSGVDMLDGTPIYDIKPYLSYADSYPEAVDGFGGEVYEHSLKVSISDELRNAIEEEYQDAIIEILREDPRTAFIEDENRIWGVYYHRYNVKFQVKGDELTVTDVEVRQ